MTCFGPTRSASRIRSTNRRRAPGRRPSPGTRKNPAARWHNARVEPALVGREPVGQREERGGEIGVSAYPRGGGRDVGQGLRRRPGRPVVELEAQRDVGVQIAVSSWPGEHTERDGRCRRRHTVAVAGTAGLDRHGVSAVGGAPVRLALTGAVRGLRRSRARSLGGVPRRVSGRPLRRSEEHTSELQSRVDLVCRLLLEKKKKKQACIFTINKKNKIYTI